MRLLALLIAFPLVAAAAAPLPAPEPAVSLKPFVATYDVRRGGKVIGETTMTLSRSGDRDWTLVTATRGTAGMARLLGLDVREESQFTQSGANRLQSLHYTYRQDATLKSRQREASFDWNANEARVTDKDEVFRYALQPGTLDRHVAIIALAQAQNEAEITLPVAAKDAVERHQFVRRETRALRLAAGEFQATRFERVDKPGKGSSWYAAGQLAPLQVEQVQKDGNNIVMELKALR